VFYCLLTAEIWMVFLNSTSLTSLALCSALCSLPYDTFKSVYPVLFLLLLLLDEKDVNYVAFRCTRWHYYYVIHTLEVLTIYYYVIHTLEVLTLMKAIVYEAGWPRVLESYGNSWNLGRPFSRPGKSRKTAKVMESHGNKHNVMDFVEFSQLHWEIL